jgi:phosphotransferase system, enzyme I, PtsP
MCCASDGTLELYATEGLKREAVHQTVLRVGEGLVGTDRRARRAAQPVRRAEPPGLLLPAGDRRGDLPLLPRRADPARRQHARRAGRAEPRAPHLFRGEVEALQTTAMVLAEMIASGELPAIAARRRTLDLAPDALIAGRPPRGVGSATSCCTSRASSSPTLIAEDVEQELERLDEAIAACAVVDDMLSRRRRPTAASTATCSKPTACSPTTAAGCGAARGDPHRPHRGGRRSSGAERHRARMLRQTDPYLRERLHDLDDLANRLLRQLMGQDHGRRARACRQRHHRRAHHGRGRAARLRPRALRGLCWRRRPTSHVAIVARALGIATVGEARTSSGLVENGDADHRRRRDRRGASAAAARRRGGLCREGALPRAPAGAIPRCARQAASPATASASR